MLLAFRRATLRRCLRTYAAFYGVGSCLQRISAAGEVALLKRTLAVGNEILRHVLVTSEISAFKFALRSYKMGESV